MARTLKLTELAVVLLAAVCVPAAAQTYPSKPIRVVVPFPPGGATDTTARMFAQLISVPLGQPIVIQNKTGATGTIGALEVARANPDGHTILYTSSSFALAPLLYKKGPYDPLGDFAQVQMTLAQPVVLVVNPQFQARNVSELIAHAKANPDAVKYGSNGAGGLSHLATSEFAARFGGLQMIHVTYKGGAPALVDLIAGQIQLIFSNTGEILPFVQGNRLRPLAILWPSRSPLLPDVPTMTEALRQPYPEIGIWHGVLVPKGTPRDVVARLHSEVNKVVQNPEVRQKLVAQGNVMLGGTPEEFTASLKAEMARWNKVVKTLDLKPLD